MERTTEFSPGRSYRYTLWREWDMFNPTYLQVVGLNPSTADEVKNDPTVRRCIDFGKQWGFGALCMTNLFGFRATNPNVMILQDDPVGSANDEWLCAVARGAGMVLAAWGVLGGHLEQDLNVCDLLRSQGGELYCLGLTKDGYPRHPLYVPKNRAPMPYEGSR